MKKTISITAIILAFIIVNLLDSFTISTISKTSIVKFLNLPILGSILVALVSIITVYLTNSFNLKKIKIENANSIHKVQFEKEFEFYTSIWGIFHDLLDTRQKLKNMLKVPHKFENFDEEFNYIYDEYYVLWSDLLKVNNSYTPFIPPIIKYKIEMLSGAILSYRKIFFHFYNTKTFDLTMIDIIDIRYLRLYDTLEYFTRTRIEQFKIID